MKDINTERLIIPDTQIALANTLLKGVNLEQHRPDVGASIVMKVTGVGASIDVDARFGHGEALLSDDWVPVVPAAFGEGTHLQIATMPICGWVEFRFTNNGTGDGVINVATLQVQ